MELGLDGKIAIICGSSGGMGRSTAEAFAREGARVVVSSRDRARIERVAEEIRNATGAEVLAVPADFRDAADIQRLVDETVEKFGGVDVLFTNTGGPPPGFFFDFTDDDWQAAFEAQLLYVVRIVRLVVPHMKKRGGGRIINNTSLSVKEPIDNLLLSNVFRAGVVALSKTLSRRLAADNILVNCVAPGYTRTGRLEQLFTARAEKEGATFEAIEKAAVEGIPIGRIPTPGEFANVVVFLASEKAGSVTGITVSVDGGVLRGLM